MGKSGEKRETIGEWNKAYLRKEQAVKKRFVSFIIIHPSTFKSFHLLIIVVLVLFLLLRLRAKLARNFCYAAFCMFFF